MADVASFYDDLSAHYHLIYADWDETLRRHGEAIDAILQARLGAGPKRVLDAACGIGTQALGLALLGHEVTGTDLSPGAVERAKREAKRLGLKLPLQVADLRRLTGYLSGPFDAVCALDNALPHLASAEELHDALVQSAGLLSPGGLLLASVRDYDSLLAERPRVTDPRVIDDKSGRRVVFQVWDWRRDGRSYALHQYFVRHGAGAKAPEGAETLVFSTTYWPRTRRALTEALEHAGLEDAAWLEPEETGFFQPIVAARAPGGGQDRTASGQSVSPPPASP